jgi:hypothetical protein
MSAHRVKSPPKLDGRLGEWRGIAPAFIYTTRRASGGYSLMQVRNGTNSIGDEYDTGCSTLAAWDDRNLYLALKVQDDTLKFPKGAKDSEPGDHAMICIDADLQGDLFDAGANEDDFFVHIGVTGDEARVSLATSSGETTPLDASLFKHRLGQEAGYIVELVCPWKALRVKPKPGLALGFDTTLFDADAAHKVETETAWSGYGYSRHNPTGWGQLILR